VLDVNSEGVRKLVLSFANTFGVLIRSYLVESQGVALGCGSRTPSALQFTIEC